MENKIILDIKSNLPERYNFIEYEGEEINMKNESKKTIYKNNNEVLDIIYQIKGNYEEQIITIGCKNIIISARFEINNKWKYNISIGCFCDNLLKLNVKCIKCKKYVVGRIDEMCISCYRYMVESDVKQQQ